MSDLISREAAINAVINIEPLAFLDTKTNKPVAATQKTLDIIKALEDLPAIDPVKHGRWIGKPIAGYSTVRCSVCKETFAENMGRWNYCPSCGARMDEGSED